MFDVKTMDLGEELKRATNLPGQERVQNLKYLIEYTKNKYGQTGVDKVMALLGRYNIKLPDLTKLDDLDWMPSDYTAQYMLAMAKAFDWQNEDVIALGKQLRSMSWLFKLVMRYFVSISLSFKHTCLTWKKHYNWGKFEVIEINDLKKFALVQISNFKKHPITCLYLMGVFISVADMITGKRSRFTETKCMFRGDRVHEFKFTWE